jgi:hypothetical protein
MLTNHRYSVLGFPDFSDVNVSSMPYTEAMQSIDPALQMMPNGHHYSGAILSNQSALSHPVVQTDLAKQDNSRQRSSISESPSDTSPIGANNSNSSGRAGLKRDSINSEEAARMAAEEDKRRRNTAASARFRDKKKMREKAMERANREMAEKCASLEQRINQLEMENRWLKELITEKNAAGKGREEVGEWWKELMAKQAANKAELSKLNAETRTASSS